MRRQSISFTEPNDEWLKRQIDNKEYSSKSELVNDLVRQARKQQRQIDWISSKLERAEKSGFTNIPVSIYWSIVTLTTVGYGDIAPITALGQFIASIIMIMGYGIIAIPTGIVSSQMTRFNRKSIATNTQSCSNCLVDTHNDNAEFCYNCGNKLNE